MAFWQATQDWSIHQGRKHYKMKGYSPVQTKHRLGKNHILKALADSAVNALKRRGFDADYEGKIPTNVHYPKVKNPKQFSIFIWFTGEHKQTFFEEE